MRLIGPIVILGVTVLTGCSGAAAPAQPGIAGRSAIAIEERSTCEALGRADLAVVGDGRASLDRTATALEDAGSRAPGDIAPALTELAAAYRDSADAAWDDPRRLDVLVWFNTHCGGSR